MRPRLDLLVVFVLSAAFAGCGPGPGVDDDDAAPVAPDPLDFANDVSEDALRQSIDDLVAMDTRFTYSAGSIEARDYLVDRLAS